MAMTSNPVLRALGRWVQKGLLAEETARILREEVEEDLLREGQRWTQFALAATAGAILIIAGATFLAWAWPEMGYAAQSLSLAVVGALVVALGVRLLGPSGLVPSGPLSSKASTILPSSTFISRTQGGSQRKSQSYCVFSAHAAIRSPTGILSWG